ncbi:hypothetical protein B0J18DRAFT_451867 [Chaetomium sp. MPI-SDFR-AT-0129]|nr:hypothetical protein B0J18DRAFT_451867 [Chaetomium sp. MPI-SDFR-AT-0129]
MAAKQQPINATISRDSADGNLARETVALQALASKSARARAKWRQDEDTADTWKYPNMARRSSTDTKFAPEHPSVPLPPSVPLKRGQPAHNREWATKRLRKPKRATKRIGKPKRAPKSNGKLKRAKQTEASSSTESWLTTSAPTPTGSPVAEQDEAQRTRRLAPEPQPEGESQPLDNVQFRILHQIICTSDFHAEKAKLFTNPPTWRRNTATNRYDGNAHHSSTGAVHNIPKFIWRSGDLSFIVFRHYRCSDATRWDLVRASDPSKVKCGETVAIVSQPLQEALDQLGQCSSPVQSWDDDWDDERFDQDKYTMEYFYHHKNILNDAVNQAEGQLRSQIDALRMYVNTQYGEMFEEVDRLASQGRVKSHDIDLLFCPNEVIVTKENEIPTAFVLKSWPTRGNTIDLECWNWAYDGHCVRRNSSQLTINKPTDAMVNIRDLNVYPLRFATEDEVNFLESRGRKFWSLRFQSFVAYDGWDWKTENYYTKQSRWMIDYKTYRQIHPSALPFQFTSNRKLPFDKWPEDIPNSREQLEKQHLLVLPFDIYGFSLKKKDWSSLVINNIKPVEWNKQAFDRLVLPHKIKDIVKSLVMVRASHTGLEGRHVLDGIRDDLIAGKGNGLIMLLHGGPGTGKTLTAAVSSVAELAEMPLYSVTCGDIGTKPEQVENYLQAVLMLGRVLLLDEADVFLEERSLADLERNSLVSVFLRTLEYYEGILVLTSNRIGIFDAAFTSRIQVALHYDTLNNASRRRVWQNFFDMLHTAAPDNMASSSIESNRENVDMHELRAHMDELASHEMNGRQIRNVFNTARQLAIFKKETLAWSHLSQALGSVGDFNSYLRRLHGHSEDQWARDERMR